MDGKQIFVFDKVLCRAFSDGVRNVAQETHFYRVPEGLIDADGKPSAVDPLFIEKWFQKIEGEFEKGLKTLSEIPADCHVPTETRERLSTFLALQYMRTRAFRNLVKDLNEQLYREICKRAISQNFGDDALKYMPRIEYKDEAAGLFQTQQFFDDDKVSEFSSILNSHIWILLINDTGEPLYTSDAPVVLHRHFAGRAVGLASPGVEIAFPISSTRILSLRERNAFRALESLDSSVQPLACENVEFYNSLQVLQSERQIYCETGSFALAEDMIKDSPQLSEKNRSRVNFN